MDHNAISVKKANGNSDKMLFEKNMDIDNDDAIKQAEKAIYL